MNDNLNCLVAGYTELLENHDDGKTVNFKSEEFFQLAGAFKAKLSDCMAKDYDGNLKMIFSILDESFRDNTVISLTQMVNAGRR